MKHKTKEQKLSSMRYIRHNKRRVSVLIISLSLCLAIIYVTNFLIMSTKSTAKKAWLDPYERMCRIGISLDFDEKEYGDMNIDEMKEIWNKMYREFANKLDGAEDVVKAFPASATWINITPPIAQIGYHIPMIEPEYADILLDHMDAKLIDGRLPENPKEIVLDKATMLNNFFEVGMTYGEEEYTITGMLDCNLYFGYGIMEEEQRYHTIYLLTDKRVEDAAKYFSVIGREYDKENDYVIDYNYQMDDFTKYVKNEMEAATKYIYIGIFVLLFVSLFVVYTTYLRDRHNEWCLYCSIGYSRRAIYLSIIGELLFTFVTAVLIGLAVTALMVYALDIIIMKPKGIACQYFYPDKITEVVSAFVLFFGLLQIPIRYALYKIRTIDAMEDDLY